MSDWITDRLPTEADSDRYGYVWVTDQYGRVGRMPWNGVTYGLPWMPIASPEPYVKPKRWRVTYHENSHDHNYYTIQSSGTLTTYRLPFLYKAEHREAAERIAAIYNEVMP